MQMDVNARAQHPEQGLEMQIVLAPSGKHHLCNSQVWSPTEPPTELLAFAL